GSDLGIIVQLILAAGFFCSYPGSRFPRLQPYRPYLGFAFFTALVTGVGLVHSVKWIMARARPYLVVKKGYPFSHWFEFGPHHISDGYYFGSLPSGHTATAILLITLSYFMAADRTHTLRTRILGWIWGILTLLFASGMAIGRSMTLHHWLSDGFGIILVGLAATQLIFFTILKVPRQVQYFRVHGQYPKQIGFWELQLLWRLLVVNLAIMALTFGIRAVLSQKAPWLGLLVIPAVLSGYYAAKSIKKKYLDSMAVFTSDSAGNSKKRSG
ncbi:MAG: phosphatase PAP2 family protein, partial [Deltaproteobacteria bacterium]|nr:phosphatase PAP2 family protein [Deltaproteobacteria bacterium]